MTLPDQIILPLRTNLNDEQDVDRYLHDLVFDLETMYEKIAQNVNGFIRNSAESDQARWRPTLNGTGNGTFTYTRQTGWAVRSGIFTEIWFDINWTATTASGNLYVELPYRVIRSDNIPFVGTIQASGIAFPAGRTYMVINGIPNTYRGEIWASGSGVTTTNRTVTASGRLIGHLRYIGLEDE